MNKIEAKEFNPGSSIPSFRELFDLSEIQSIQDAFAKTTGVASIINETDGSPITRPSNYCRLCRDVIRNNKKGLSGCIDFYAEINRYNPDGPVSKHCLNGGLLNAGTNITIGGKHIATWFIGQVRDKNTDINKMVIHAEKIGINTQEFRDALDEVTVMSQEEFNQVCQTLQLISKQISRLAYQKILQEHIILKQRKTEEALRKSEERFILAMDANSDGLWDWDVKTDEVYYSPGYAAMLDYKTNEISPHVKTWMDLIHPDDKDTAVKANMDCIENQCDDFNVKLRMKSKNGEWRWILARGRAVTRGTDGRATRMLGTHTDITERMIAKKALTASHERFITVLNSIDATIYVADMDTYEILFINKYMIESFGRDMTGEICWDVFRGESGPCSFCTNRKLIDENGNPTGVHVWQDKNPVTGKWYNNYDRAIEWTDGRLVRLQIATDISDQMKMEDELRQAHKMESIGTLAGGIAHDFNNILSIIIGNTKLALDEIPVNDPIHANIQEIKIASLRAKDVVRQLLSFSRKTEQKQKPIDLSPVIKESLKLIRATIPSSISIHDNVPEISSTVQADATQIHQVIINLCTNAAHAMSEKGGDLKISLQDCIVDRIAAWKVKNMTPGNYLELIIKDTGYGIDQSIREKMFDPYFTTKEVGEGTGMGLSVVHGIVKNHNGYIHVESEPGTGTAFHIYFPVTDQKSSHPANEIIQHNSYGTESILFVDDETSIVDMTKKVLGKLGYKIEGKSNPHAALEMFREKPSYFDLVISDMTMPGMSGIQLTEKLKEIRSDIPVIICTGHSSLLDKEKAENTGISAFVMKPVSVSKIAKIIRDIFDKKQDLN